MIKKDTLWKGIIEDLAEEFVHFFFADYTDQIDFSKGFVFLDKELEQLSPQSDSPLRHADKLFKGWLKVGSEQWFLVHVEVQGYADPQFAYRMYQYAYRIEDRYQKPVTALVIYTDTDRRYHFYKYRSSFLGTELAYRFRTFILMDHSPALLRQSPNLFALVMEVARRDLDYRKGNDWQRLDGKLELVRHLLQRGIIKSKIRHLLNFIGHYTAFEESKFLHKFEEDLDLIIKARKPMGIQEAILHEVEERGIEKGLKQGLEQGIEKGIEKGAEEKERIFVTRGWKKGMRPQDIADLADMPLEKVQAIIEELERGI